MEYKMLTPTMANRSGKENVVDVIAGWGEDVTRVGDKVRIGYEVFNKKKLFVDHCGDPLELTLGNAEYGREFDEGIFGMKVQQTRHIYMKPNKKLRSRNFVRDALLKLKLKNLPDYEYYQVTVLAMLDETGWNYIRYSEESHRAAATGARRSPTAPPPSETTSNMIPNQPVNISSSPPTTHG